MLLTVRQRAGLFGSFCRPCAATLALIRADFERGAREPAEYVIRGTRRAGRPPGATPETLALETALLDALAAGPRPSRKVKEELGGLGFAEVPLAKAVTRLRKRGALVVSGPRRTTVWSLAPSIAASAA